MPILKYSDPPCHLNHYRFHHYKSINQISTSHHLPMINQQYPLLPYQRSSINIPHMFNVKHKAKMVLRASNNHEPETSAQVKQSSPAWKRWMVGIILSIILPSFRHKWGPLLALKSKVDMTIETVESVTEVVEELAKEVEKVADEVANKQPDDTKLKEAMESVENLAKEAVQEAELAEELVNKIEEVETEAEEALMGPDIDQAKEEDSPKMS